MVGLKCVSSVDSFRFGYAALCVQARERVCVCVCPCVCGHSILIALPFSLYPTSNGPCSLYLSYSVVSVYDFIRFEVSSLRMTVAGVLFVYDALGFYVLATSCCRVLAIFSQKSLNVRFYWFGLATGADVGF